ncbi:hypothetical protein PO909_016829, partial [Leuciscus waleckii]
TQQSIISSFSHAVPYDKKTKRHEDITKAVAYFIAKDMLPISVVENEGFKKLIRVLDSRYELPDRKHFSQTAIPRMYTKCRERAGKDKRMDRAVGLCKKVVAAFSFSWKKKRDLATAQEELKLPKHKLVTESPTRWGSRQKMVARMIEQHKAISQLLNPSDDDTQLTKDIKTAVIEYLNEKYDDEITDELLDMASLLDPRFKTQYIRPDKIEAIKTRAVTEILKMEGDQGPSTSQASCRTEEIEAEKQRKSLGSFFKKPCPSNTGLSDMQAVEGELENYLMGPDADSETEPLDWWKVYDKKFPKVSQLARRYLCIPATSSPSERIFSTGGNIVTCHSAALKPETVDKLVFLARNL